MSNINDQYPVVIQVPVAWGEMDAFGHVNNIIYFRYFESARIAYFDATGFVEMMDTSGLGPILAQTQARFKAPLSYPDTVHVGARVPRVETDRFTMEYAVWSEAHQRVAAEGSGLIVCYNYREKRKAAVPDQLRERIRSVEALVGG
jgi:acyl-CoA thioester hydrolase